MKEIIHDVLSVLNPNERKRVARFIFLNTMVNLADICTVVCLLFVVKFYTQPFPAVSPLLAHLFSSRNSVLPALILLVMFIIKNIAGHLMYRAQVSFISRVAVRISRQNLSAYLQGPFSVYAHVDSSVLASRIIHQPTEFSQHVLQGLQQTITEILLIIFSIAALVIYDTRLFLIVLVTLLPAMILLSWLTGKKLEKIKQHIKVAVEQSLQYLGEALTGYVESNIYDRNHFFVGRHEEAQKKVGDYIARIQTTQDMPARFFEVFAILGLFVLIVAIKYAPSVRCADVGMVGAFMAAAYKIIPSISRIINLTGKAGAYRYTIAGAAGISSLRTAQETPKQKIESVECRNVYFSYHELQVLNGFSLRLCAGSFVGISGDSGSGKTTLLQILLGFNTPDAGSVLINGKAAGDIERISPWNGMAYVKQDPFILHDSILNNIVLFEEGYDHDRLSEILEVTGLGEMAGPFPEGIHRPVMEAGKDLSGGQRKRLALARALYKDADVLLFDEPFSELDECSELSILRHLKKLASKGKLIVLVSHHSRSFQFCDTVIHVPRH